VTLKYLHTMVRVSDLDASIAFYKLLGLVETRRHESEQGRFTLVFLAPPDQPECPVELTYNWDGDEGLPTRFANILRIMVLSSTVRPATATWPLYAALTMFPLSCCKRAKTLPLPSLGRAWRIRAIGKAQRRRTRACRDVARRHDGGGVPLGAGHGARRLVLC